MTWQGKRRKQLPSNWGAIRARLPWWRREVVRSGGGPDPRDGLPVKETTWRWRLGPPVVDLTDADRSA